MEVIRLLCMKRLASAFVIAMSAAVIGLAVPAGGQVFAEETTSGSDSGQNESLNGGGQGQNGAGSGSEGQTPVPEGAETGDGSTGGSGTGTGTDGNTGTGSVTEGGSDNQGESKGDTKDNGSGETGNQGGQSGSDTQVNPNPQPTPAPAPQPEPQVRTGWQDIDGGRYYLNANSVRLTGWQFIDGAWYWLGGDGRMTTGWQLVNGTWYYMDGSGRMLTGWQYINGRWYYLTGSGAMAANQYINGYWVDASGAWDNQPPCVWHLNSIGWWFGASGGWYAANQWEFLNGSWYYFDRNGYMVTGWRVVNGTWYYMNLSGAMLSSQYVDGYWLGADGGWRYPYRASWKLNATGWWYGDDSGWYAANTWYYMNGQWYWFDANGYMATGWHLINGTWYYLSGSGAMLHDTWVGGRYHLNSGGDMTIGNIIIVLDPGHGGHDSGAVAYGVEKDLNLKIALACRNELQTYKGVSVYMTRSDDTFVDLTGRSQLARNISPAAILVSIHNNAVGTSGSEVWAQNNNYNLGTAEVTQGLGRSILNQLVSLGLQDNGVKTRSEVEGRYSDGSAADWYSINRESKKRGLPGMIVEHAYVDNYSDYVNYLSSDEKLTALGQADARGIAQYFGLSK